jgi:hypothetical protein
MKAPPAFSDRFRVDDRGQASVRVDLAEGGLQLVALQHVVGDQAIGKAELLQQDRDLVAVGGGHEVDVDHQRLLAA